MDYRESHLEKGKDYDLELLQGSFSSYMTQREYALLKTIIPKLFPNKIPRYLDFACGTGRILALLEQFAEVSYGIDISASMLAEAKYKCKKAQLLLGDITKGELLHLEPFSLVTAFRFFGNAQDELRRAALASLNHLLVPGGYLVLNNHRNPWSATGFARRFMDSEDGRGLTYFKLRSFFREAGFRIVQLSGIGSWLLMHRMSRQSICNSKIIQLLEPLSLVSCISPFCPDMIIVAQKNGHVAPA